MKTKILIVTILISLIVSSCSVSYKIDLLKKSEDTKQVEKEK